jgi:uncharacterized RDD family membrane protein YckC
MFSNKIIKALPGRISSAVIDQVSLVVSSIIFSVGKEFASTPEEVSRIKVNTAIILFSIFLNKDLFFGRSIGKYLTGLRVVSFKTGNPASPIQCLVRNLFLLLWPLEALILLFSPIRRIGDIVAGTKVAVSEEINSEMKLQYVQVVLSVIASFILIYYLFNYVDRLGIMN